MDLLLGRARIVGTERLKRSLAKRSYRDRLWQLWRVLSSEPYQRKLRSKSPNIRPTEDRWGNYIITAGERVIVKPSDSPSGIVFNDGSFLVVYEKWSKEPDVLLGYRYHYQRSDGWFVRYDMHEEEMEGHPKHHFQASVLGKNIRLPTGEVACEDVLKAIIEQFLLRDD